MIGLAFFLALLFFFFPFSWEYLVLIDQTGYRDQGEETPICSRLVPPSFPLIGLGPLFFPLSHCH